MNGKMKTYILFISFIFIGYNTYAQAQKSSSKELDTVYISVFFKPQHIEMQDLSGLVNKEINKLSATTHLKELLDLNTDLFFKEYGRGMLSSISVRGTGASHTLVLWNGIPINSKLNGQVDFNTLSYSGLNQIKLKKGGESVLFGSGAIGGVIELGQSLIFKNHQIFSNSFHYGSFFTVANESKIQLGSEKTFFAANFTSEYSKNDYLYPGKNVVNANGKYKAQDFQLSLGKRINRRHIISFQSHYNNLSRNLSRTLYAPSNSKLKTLNTQAVGTWEYHNNVLRNVLNLGYVFEKYNYFPNKDITDSSMSASQNFILKNETNLNLKNNQLTLGNLFENTWADGEHIDKHQIQNYSVYANLLHKYKRFKFHTGLRKEFHSSYSIPLLIRFKIDYHNPQDFFKTGISYSTNYKVPNLNDLYWVPGGNPNLKAEKSKSIEAFAGVNKKYYNFKITGYYIHSNNLIKWIPFTQSLWKPVNFEEVSSRGFEVLTNAKIRFNSASLLKIKASFNWQQVTNLSNHKLLPYIPMQTAILALNYNYKKMDLSITDKYVGKVYTTSSNTLFLPSYQIFNAKALYKINSAIFVGGGINNLFNTFYETFPSRPQPGRNYYINIQIKIKKS